MLLSFFPFLKAFEDRTLSILSNLIFLISIDNRTHFCFTGVTINPAADFERALRLPKHLNRARRITARGYPDRQVGAPAPVLERIGCGLVQTDILARNVIPRAEQSLTVSHVGPEEDALWGVLRGAPLPRTPCIIPSVGLAPGSLRDATCVLYLRWTG